MNFCSWMCVHKIIEKTDEYVLQSDVVMLFALSSFILWWVNNDMYYIQIPTVMFIYFFMRVMFFWGDYTHIMFVFVLYILLLLYIGLVTLVNMLNHLDNQSSRFYSNQIYMFSFSLRFFFFLSFWWLVKYNWHLVWKSGTYTCQVSTPFDNLFFYLSPQSGSISS